MRQPLACYEKEPVSAVFVSWLVFGSNGRKVRPGPGELTIASYTRRGFPGEPHPYGRHGKLIARPSRVACFGPHGSHNAVFLSGHAVNPRWYEVYGSTGEPDIDTFRLNHYYHRSAEEAAAKIRRQDRNAVAGFQPDAARLAAHDRNEVEDAAILRFLPHLKERLAAP